MQHGTNAWDCLGGHGATVREIETASVCENRLDTGEVMTKKVLPISIKLLGGLSVTVGDDHLPLPASRKTRALLGYFLLAEDPQRRDRLCELFWDIPDDPRGALRWSLSKLRPIVNFGGLERLKADRERVTILLDDLDVDLHRIRTYADEDSTPEIVSKAWQATRQILLEDCELPNLPGFSTWLQHERRKVATIRASFAKRMTLCEVVAPEEAILWAERWLDDRPFDPDAAQAVVACLRRVGRIEEALSRAGELEAEFQRAGIKQPTFATGSPTQDPLPTVKEYVPATRLHRPRQTVRFAKADDGVSLAWASVGNSDAPPLVKAANWLTHLELDWEAPIWSPIYRELATGFRLIRYDERGCGLSDWDVPEIDFDSFVNDLEVIVDAAGLDRFPLLGISQGASVSIEYAARHPERVSHLILFGGYPAGWRHLAQPAEVREREAVMVLTEAGWGRPSSSYRHLFSNTFMPDATHEELAWFDEFQRRTTSPRNATRFLQAFSQIDVRQRLAELDVPTLVIHSRGDQRIPVATARELAASIRGAQFVSLESNNHLLIGREPASAAFIAAIRQFVTATQ